MANTPIAPARDAAPTHARPHVGKECRSRRTGRPRPRLEPPAPVGDRARSVPDRLAISSSSSSKGRSPARSTSAVLQHPGRSRRCDANGPRRPDHDGTELLEDRVEYGVASVSTVSSAGADGSGVPVAAARASAVESGVERAVDAARSDVGVGQRRASGARSIAEHRDAQLGEHEVVADARAVDAATGARRSRRAARRSREPVPARSRVPIHARSSIGSPRWASSKSSSAVRCAPSCSRLPDRCHPARATADRRPRARGHEPDAKARARMVRPGRLVEAAFPDVELGAHVVGDGRRREQARHARVVTSSWCMRTRRPPGRRGSRSARPRRARRSARRRRRRP